MKDVAVITPPWLAGAVCASVDPYIFYPKQGGSTAAAKAVCATCPVIAACLSYALEEQIPFGVWGGVTAFERRPMLRAMRAAS